MNDRPIFKMKNSSTECRLEFEQNNSNRSATLSVSIAAIVILKCTAVAMRILLTEPHDYNFTLLVAICLSFMITTATNAAPRTQTTSC